MKHTPNNTPLPPANREERNTSPYRIVREQRCKCAEATVNTLRNSESSRYPKEKAGRRKTKNIKLHKIYNKTTSNKRVWRRKKEREKKYFQFITIWYLTYIYYLYFLHFTWALPSLISTLWSWSWGSFIARCWLFLFFSGGQRSSAQVFIYFSSYNSCVCWIKSWREAEKSHKSHFFYCFTKQRWLCH